MSVSCEIEFENSPRKIVYAGQLLRGTVRLNLTEKITVRSVCVRINGKAFAKWNHGKTKIVVKESYFDEKVYLVSGTTGEIQLEPGTYNYTFEFTLPSDVPSSIQGKYGHIKHNVRVVLDFPFKFNKEFKEQFTLMKALNLNDFPSLRQPLIVNLTKEMYPGCFTCFGSGSLKIRAQTPVSGFLPRQTVNLEINVNNQSDLIISQFTIELIQSINYSKKYSCFGCQNSYKKLEEKCLLQKTNDGCGGNKDKIMHIDVDIPPTHPTEISMSKNIKVTYSIRIKAVTPALYRNVILNLPITIGSFPFQDNV